MNPYAVLGLHETATLEQAKDAYRRAAMQHHPDREGGDEKKFKEAKAAWELIEKGWRPPRKEAEQTPFGSSFGAGPKPQPKRPGPTAPKTDKPTGKTAGKPAPGYEPKGPPKLPQTTTRHINGSVQHFVTIEINEDQAFEGCVVPFRHGRHVFEYEVRPGSFARTEQLSFAMDPTIGSNAHLVWINITLVVSKRRTPEQEVTRDAEITINLCALGLFTGGKITVTDHLGEKIPISIPSGYDPTQKIVVEGRGYGSEGQRGKLFITIKPVFKQPHELNANELMQLTRLNDMVKR